MNSVTLPSRSRPDARVSERTAPRRHILSAAIATAFCVPAAVQALPEGAQVAAGAVTVRQGGGQMSVIQTSPRAIVNWNAFGVAAGEALRLQQPSGSAAMLARVVGDKPSLIHGSVQADGRLYLINPQGVLVGPGGRIDTAAFIASTRDVGDAEFLTGGSLTFTGSGLGGVTNLGTIRAREGNVLLVGHQVRNGGELAAAQGTVSLSAADEVFLASPDAAGVLVRAGNAGRSDGTAVENTGLIEAAQAQLQAAGGDLFQLAVNQSGVVRATGVAQREGRIVLTADGGTVVQAGRLVATNGDGSGGAILVGGDRSGQGDTPRAARALVPETASLEASATAPQGAGGKVVVWADERTQFDGRIAARGGRGGGDGGQVEVSGKRQLQFGASGTVDTVAPAGKAGTLLLDPDEITIAATGTDPAPAGSVVTMTAATLQGLLAAGNVVLDTSTFNPASGSGHIRVDQDLAWNNASALTLKSGNGIAINASVNAPAANLTLLTGKSGYWPEQVWGSTDTAVRVASGATVNVDTLRVGVNAQAQPAGSTFELDRDPTASLLIDGVLRANGLELDTSSGAVGVIADGNNALGTIRSTGGGPLGLLNIQDTSGDLKLQLSGTDSGYVRIVTPGTLTLQAGTQLAPSAAQDIILASTSGGFVNEAGAAVFGPNARYLIYTNSTAATVKGGLTGTDEFTRTFAANPPENYAGDTTSRFLYAAAGVAPDLTYTADGKTKHYGDANPALTYAVTGLQPGDVLANVTSGAPALATTATVNSGVGTYAISIGRGTLSSPSYTFTFVPATLTVEAAPLTLDIANAARAYGDLNPAFTASLTGLKAGDTADAILAGWILSSAATRTSNVGTYAIEASANSPSLNYSYTVRNGALSVNPAAVTVSLPGTTREYGTENPNFLPLAVGDGLKNGDSVATAFPAARFTTTATPGSSIGSYPVTASGLANPNYAVTTGALGNLSIYPATLVLAAADASRLYGDANPAFELVSASGFRNGDSLASVGGLSLVTSATPASPVGAYPVTVQGSAANYDIVSPPATLTVRKAPLVVRLNSATRPYGDPNPALTATYEGLRNGETSLPGLTAVSEADPQSPVGNYPIMVSGTTVARNYEPVFYGAALTVAPRPLTVIAATTHRPYGQPNPELNVTVTGATSWDQSAASRFWVASTPAGERSPAGPYAVTLATSPYGDRFDNLTNYRVTLQPGQLEVTRVPVTVRATPLSMVWGDEVPVLGYTITGGLLPWDREADAAGAELATDAVTLASRPGNYAIRVANAQAGQNYEAVLDGAQHLTVQRRPITITASYATTQAGLNDIMPGRIEPYMTVRRQGGNDVHILNQGPLAEGPQFTVLGVTDGTSTGLFTHRTASYVEAAAGWTLADVLAYYDPVSKPGVATVQMSSGELVLKSSIDPGKLAPMTIEVPKITLVKPAGPPGMAQLLDDAWPDNAALGRALAKFKDTEIFRHLDQAERALVLDALAGDRIWEWYRSSIEETEAWIAMVKRDRPDNWQAMVASAEADIREWRTKLDATPSLENIRLRAAAGDPVAARALMPILGATLMQSVAEGRASPETQASLMQMINGQRAEAVALADRKYEAAMSSRGSAPSLLGVFSAPKIPDVVGQAMIEMTESQQAKNIMAAGVAGSVFAGGLVAGSMITMFATVSGVSGASLTLLANLGAATVIGGPAAVAGIALAIGVAEAVQVAESTKNYDRYQAFRSANGQLNSLDGFDLKNKDNLMQMTTAISTLLAQGVGKGTP